MPKPKLLLLDHSKLILQTLIKGISNNKVFNPYEAQTYEEAKKLIDEHQFSAAILDLELPDAKNAEQIDYVLSRNIPVIILTGTFNEKLSTLASRKDIIDYIIKGSQEDIKNAVQMAENILLYKNKRALIVDDSKVIRYQIQEHLNRLGFITQEADSAESALDMIKRLSPFDLITVDYQMPGKNGVQFIQEAKSIQNTYATVYFGVFGSDSSELSIRFLKSGANDTFVKPLEKETFNVKIANVFLLISKQKALNEAENILNKYINAIDSSSIITKADINGLITFVSKNYSDFLGYTIDELIGQSHNILRHPQTSQEVFKNMWETITKGDTWTGIIQNRKKSGESFFVKLTVVPLLNANGDVMEFFSICDNVTELVHLKKELQEQFYTDSLTHIENRNKLNNDLKYYENPFFAIIHLNNFKEINSFYGESIGDHIIKQFSKQLFEIFYNHGYKTYRMTGVNFALLKESAVDVDTEVNTVSSLLKNIEDDKFIVNEHTLEISISCGIAQGKECVPHADIARKIANSEDKFLQLYNDSLKETKEYKQNIMWISKIKHALNHQNIICYYQPIVNNKTGEIIAYEVLVRLKDEDGSIISPFHFLKIADENGLYHEISKRVITNAFKTFEHKTVDFSLNLTVSNILHTETRELLIAHLKNLQGNGNHAVIELVESASIESFEEVQGFIRQIKSLGAKLAIDHFGTGYSDFEYLAKLEPDFIKIDGSLIHAIDTDERAYNVVKAIVSLAHRQSYKVVAEYVETESIKNSVQKLGIEYSQGHYFYEPLCAVELEKIL